MQLKLFFLFFLIIIIPSVFGLGVSPGIVNIEFEPNLTTSFEMKVYNTPVAVERDVKVYASFEKLDNDIAEELKDSFVLEKEILHFTSQDNIKSLNVSINLPQGLSRAGLYEVRFGALELVSNEGGISAIAGALIRVFINTSQQYASPIFAKKKDIEILEVKGEDVKSGEKSNINVIIKSFSDTDLTGVYGKIKVMQENKEIKILETGKININPNEVKTLKAVFDTTGIKGTLVLNAEVFYDSKSEKANGVMNILQGLEKKSPWWLVILILVLLLLAILFLLWYFLRKRRKENLQQIV